MTKGIIEIKMCHTENFFTLCARICDEIDKDQIESLVGKLKNLREKKGRLFILGVGGSAGNAGHAVNDFRKLCGIEAYAPTDNVSELTARTNDEGFETVFEEYLRISQAKANDALLIFSVGGGDEQRNVSVNLIRATNHAKDVGMEVYGVVGRDGGFVKLKGDEVVVVPNVDNELVTPLSESFQAIVWHALVSHPDLQIVSTKW